MGHLGKALLIACVATLVVPAMAAAAGPPQIDASWVTEVTATGAKLRAEINPDGLETSYRFEYISDAAYRANLGAAPPRDGFFGAAQAPPGKEAGIGSGTVPLAEVQSASSLAPATAYHYRVVATNSGGPPVIGPEHVFTTQETSLVFRLPDNRGWELVSPVDKNGGAIAAPEAIFGGGDIQAAAVDPGENAPAVTYGSTTSFGEAAGAPPASQYSSRRTAAGWLTGNVSAPLESAAYGDDPDGAPYRLFSSDLSHALLFGGLACRGGLPGCPEPNQPLPGSGAPPGYMAFYMRDNSSGAFASLLSAADVAPSSVSPQAFEVSLAAASPDLAHVVLSSCAALTADASEIAAGPQACDPEEQNLYEWSAGGLTAVNGAVPGAGIAAPSGAVSSDGSRVYWTRGPNLYLREGAQTSQVDEAQGGGGTFQTATPDGSIAFFTKGGHLFRFVATAKAALDITPGGGVVGVLGASADGSYVYYQDAAGLQLWHAGVTTTVAAGDHAAAESDYPPATGTARVSADGLRLVFLSKA